MVGHTDTAICPVMAILDYKGRGNYPGPFFVWDGASTITKSWFVAQLWEILAAVEGQFVGHSFCIGAVMTAALVGIEDSTIHALGCWHSVAFLQYIPKNQLHPCVLGATL